MSNSWIKQIRGNNRVVKIGKALKADFNKAD